MDLSELPPIPSSHILAEVRWRRPTSLKFPRLKTFQDWPRQETWFQPEDFLVTTAKCFNWTIARGIMVWWKHQVIENMRCFSYYFLRLTSGLSSNIFVLKHLKTSFTVPHAFSACSPGFQPPRSVKTLAKMQNVLDCCAWSDCGESALKKYVKQVLSLTSCILPHPYYNVIINDISSERCVCRKFSRTHQRGASQSLGKAEGPAAFSSHFDMTMAAGGRSPILWNMSFEDGQSIQPAFTPPKKNWAKALFGGF